MGNDDLRERTQRVLTTRGLDLCEHFVMCCGGVESPAPGDLFAQYAKTLADGDPRGEFPLEEFEAAYQRLLSRGLLTTITTEDLARNEDGPTGRQNYHLGDVVLSKEGYRLHTDAIQEIFEGRLPPGRFTGIRRNW